MLRQKKKKSDGDVKVLSQRLEGVHHANWSKC